MVKEARRIVIHVPMRFGDVAYKRVGFDNSNIHNRKSGC